ncbi:MAG TPA: Uma2 family endonuclease [Verrucomicrobiae bacterium]|jgi:Uma2 family endonuclease
MTAALDQKGKRWTYEEYYNLESDQRYEVIDGSLLMAPAPDTWHQDWLNQLNVFLTLYLRKKKNPGRLFIAPVDVVLDDENVVQPDLVFVAEKNLHILQRRAVFGAPDLVVEMISPSSVRRDRYEKMSLYARFGVKEYWIGDPANRSLEILTLTGDRYVLHCSAEEKGKLTSLVLTGLEFDLSELER